MKHRSTTAAVAAAVLVTGVLAAPAGAQAAPLMLAADTTGQATTAFAAALGSSRTGGVYRDESGRMVVAVTDPAAAASVRAAGGQAQVVAHSTDYLNGVDAQFSLPDSIAGMSWGVDPKTNRVEVEADSTVSAADFARLKTIAARYGTAASVTRVPGALSFESSTNYTSGGWEITSSSRSLFCSLGFNAQNSSGQRYFITAGHCGKLNADWYQNDGGYLGSNHEVGFGTNGNDFAVVTYLNSAVSAYGTVWVNGAQKQITTSGNPSDGDKVERVGAVSSDLNGEVLEPSTDVTVKDPVTGKNVKLTGLIKTSLCALHGDSGGPLFEGSKALGILSTGTNTGSTCNSTSPNDTRTYFQPIQEVLNHDGLTVY